MAKHKKMLSNYEASYIQTLMRAIETQSKTTLANWAIDYSEKELLPLYIKYFPEDIRAESALNAAKRWLKGEIKLPEAKKYILECHAAAREAEGNPVAQGIARAIGQSASTIHSARHCIGLAFYGALAVAYERFGVDATWAELEGCAAEECEKMLMTLKDISVYDEENPAKIVWHC